MILREKPLIHHYGDRVNVGLSFQASDMAEIKLIFGEIEENKDYTYSIKKKCLKRSLDANAYAWVLISKLAEVYGMTKDEVYQKQIENMHTYEIVCLQEEAADTFIRVWSSNGLGWICEKFPSKIKGCVNIRAHYGSSQFNSRDMSIFIDNIIHECNIAKIPTDYEMIQRLKEEWE